MIFYNNEIISEYNILIIHMSKCLSLLCIIFVMAFISMVLDIKKLSKEGFLNLTPGNYPISVDKPILHGFYNEKKNPGVTANQASDIYNNYPVFPASCSYNNNIRYWKKPTNGKCEPAEFCGGLYEETIHPIPKPPRQPRWDNGTRVNYYESSAFCE